LQFPQMAKPKATPEAIFIKRLWAEHGRTEVERMLNGKKWLTKR
jgi:hypothetical protein